MLPIFLHRSSVYAADFPIWFWLGIHGQFRVKIGRVHIPLSFNPKNRKIGEGALSGYVHMTIKSFNTELVSKIRADFKI